MPSILNTIATPLLGGGGLIGAAVAYQNKPRADGFDNTSSGLVAIIVIIVLLAVAFCILGAVATYRLTGSAAQVILYILFGNIYLMFAWIYYGITGHKLVKITRGL